MRVESEGGYSNISLNEALTAVRPEPRDRAFITRLVYGVLEKNEYIDHVISSYVKPGARIEPEVRCILRMAVYQMVFMNTPDAAAVNESVNLAKKLKLFRATGFINGLLRSFIRDGKQISLPDRKRHPMKYLSVKYSCPEWLAELWSESYGEDLCEKILAGLEGRPPIYVRVNPMKISSDALRELLEAREIRVIPSGILPDCLAIEEAGDITELPEYQNGFFHVQDGSSQLCCAIASPESGSLVYDVCAAAEGAERLGFGCIQPTVRDALEPSEARCADLVLCDVPCSGLGIIRRKPDIKRKSWGEIEGLPDLQRRILENSACMVKKGGRLIYSTCTLHPAENVEVIGAFLKQHGEFEPCPISLPEGLSRAIDEPDYTLTLFPHIFNTDGFFISAVRRKD